MRFKQGWLLASSAAITLLAVGFTAAQAPAPPKVSSFAPAADLVAQVNYFIERIDEALASETAYTAAKKAKVGKDASTLAVIGLALSMHDEDHALKQAAPAILAAAKTLATSAETYAGAQKGLADLKAAVAGSQTGTPPAEWEKVAVMEDLMKQVPLLNSSLKRGTLPARFKANVEENAGLAATLAAIGQASMSDTHVVKQPADLAKWYKYCADFRDAAGAVNAAIRAGDQPGTTAAVKTMATTCDTCHETFRPEEL